MAIQSFLPLADNASMHTVISDGVAISYVVWEPTEIRGYVHLLHGFTGSKEDFWELGSLLSQYGWYTVAHDHRGQHQSQHAPAETYTLAQLARDARAVQLAVTEEKFHVLGHSFGGLVAQQFALDFPEALASLTLFCSGPAAPHPSIGWLQIMHDFLQGKTLKDAWHLLDSKQYPEVNFTTDGDVSSLMTQRWWASDSHSVRAQAKILLTAQDRTDLLAQLSCPAHVVFGEFDDAWGNDVQIAMAQRIGADVTVIESAGHCPNEEKPQETALVLNALWEF